MRKPVTYCMDIEHSAEALLFALFLIAIDIVFSIKGMVTGIVITSALAMIFGAIAVRGFTRIRIAENGIKTMPLMGKGRSYRWEEIKEVGVIGTKVFPKVSESSGGRKYIYFSMEELDEDSRFNLALNWPPSIPYTSYGKEKLEKIAIIWKGRISYYNARYERQETTVN